MSCSRWNAVLAALLVGVVLMLPTCGGPSTDSKNSGADSDAGADRASGGSVSGVGADGQSSMDRCHGLAVRWQNLLAGSSATDGGGPQDDGSIRSQIEALDGEFPEPVAEAFATFATATGKVLEVLDGREVLAHQDGEDQADRGAVVESAPVDLDDRLEAVIEISEAAGLTEALARIEAYFGSSCPPD